MRDWAGSSPCNGKQPLVSNPKVPTGLGMRHHRAGAEGWSSALYKQNHHVSDAVKRRRRSNGGCNGSGATLRAVVGHQARDAENRPAKARFEAIAWQRESNFACPAMEGLRRGELKALEGQSSGRRIKSLMTWTIQALHDVDKHELSGRPGAGGA